MILIKDLLSRNKKKTQVLFKKKRPLSADLNNKNSLSLHLQK